MGLVILLLFPVVGRWFFKRFDDRISQYIFVLGMVFLGAFLAEAAGIEAIIGAFLAGLALNRLIPHTSPLMNRIEFVGNALFIPFFLIGVGMLIDFRAFVKDWNTIKVAALMTATATVAKFLAAWLTQKTFRFSADERRVIFGLSNAQAAATLAAVLVGYNVILNKEELRIAEILGTDVAPIRLLGEEILNGSILMILVTCTIATFAAQKGANNIAFAEDTAVNEPEGDGEEERILIPLSSEEGAVELVNLSLAIKSKSNKKGLYALHVVNKDRVASGGGEKQGRKLLEVAVKTASAADVHMQDLLRYDLNLVNGITSVVREHSISDIILGLTRQKTLSSSFLGNLTDGILTRVNTTTIIYRHNQPLSTIKRHVVVVPPRAERETGFPFWVSKLWNIARNTGARIVFYGSESTLAILKQVQERHPAELGFEQFDDWNDFLVLSRELHNDHNLVVVMSRKDHPSFHPVMQRIPNYLNKYFEKFNFILIYPMQIGVGPSGGLNLRDPAFLEPLELLEEVGNTLSKLFRKK
jgi:nucleotide-binding universal stress UspA family protein